MSDFQDAIVHEIYAILSLLVIFLCLLRVLLMGLRQIPDRSAESLYFFVETLELGHDLGKTRLRLVRLRLPGAGSVLRRLSLVAPVAPRHSALRKLLE